MKEGGVNRECEGAGCGTRIAEREQTANDAFYFNTTVAYLARSKVNIAVLNLEPGRRTSSAFVTR